jgi:hypothetical protein
VLFGCVVGELAVLPIAGEGFEFVDGDLVVGRVGGLLLVVEDRLALDLAPAGAVDPPGRGLVRPREHLVEPVDAPVAKLAVAEIEELPPSARMDPAVEGADRRRAAVEVPVHPLRDRRVGRRLLRAAAVVGEEPDHADLPCAAVLQELQR